MVVIVRGCGGQNCGFEEMSLRACSYLYLHTLGVKNLWFKQKPCTITENGYGMQAQHGNALLVLVLEVGGVFVGVQYLVLK